MWESDHKESWAPKNWWFWTVVLEKTLESPLDSWISSATLWICVWASSRSWWWTGKPGVLQFMDLQMSKPVNNPKGNQSWIFIGRTDAEAEAAILGPPDAENWLTGKDLDAEKDWRRDEKGMTGWDGWMSSLTQWTCVWASSGSWWWTGKPGVLQSMESQRVGHNWATELNWTGC